MNLVRVFLAACTMCCLAATSGCGADDPESVDESCNRNSGCPFGEVCNRVKRACERESADRFVGTLSCEYTPAFDTPISYMGASDIAGWMMVSGGERALRVRTNAGAFCAANKDAGQFTAVGIDTTGVQYALSILLPFPKAGVFEIVHFDERVERTDDAGFAQVSAAPPGTTTSMLVGSSLAGFVALSADASNGAILTMYVDIVVASEN